VLRPQLGDGVENPGGDLRRARTEVRTKTASSARRRRP